MSRILLTVFLFSSLLLYSQEEKPSSFFVDANYFYGTILRHNKDISHLVTNHPEGLILSYNRKTFGYKRWEQEYNYPDFGFSFLLQDNNNDVLGDSYGLYGHFNFYFLKRNLFFRVGQGLAYNTNAFDLDKNYKNNAYGSDLLFSTYLMLNYNKQNIFKHIGVQAGITLVHYSNGNFKAPNSSTNTFSFNIGMHYAFNEKENPEYISDENPENITEPLKFNFVLRGGLNESDYLNLGQHPFFVISAFVDKRLSYKSTLQFGADFFNGT